MTVNTLGNLQQDATQSDLIERLKKQFPHSWYLKGYALNEAITALREQEAKIERLTSRGIEDMQTRIAELEKKNAQYAKMCVRNDEWLCARDQEIQRLDAALRAKQAKIDALMWEFCPDEMTSEQITEWKKHQALSGEGG
jgi:predicted RNase H-like nuclease (RuvC/YqgF family)